MAWCEQAITAYRQRQQWSELAAALLLQTRLTLRAGDKELAQAVFNEAQSAASQMPTSLTPRAQ